MVALGDFIEEIMCAVVAKGRKYPALRQTV